ncbi:MAG TPA: hypothetical protein VGB30_01960 [bacterium]|jgi:hypothetical protein
MADKQERQRSSIQKILPGKKTEQLGLFDVPDDSLVESLFPDEVDSSSLKIESNIATPGEAEENDD